MHGTRYPLSAWFKAMWWFTTRKSGVNAFNMTFPASISDLSNQVRMLASSTVWRPRICCRLVQAEGMAPLLLKREKLQLTGSGSISLGRSTAGNSENLIWFEPITD